MLPRGMVRCWVNVVPSSASTSIDRMITEARTVHLPRRGRFPGCSFKRAQTVARPPQRSIKSRHGKVRATGVKPVDVIPTQRIRNVVLVGHSGCGKTTLVEALLHRAGRHDASRQSRRRHHGHRHRSRGSQARHVAVARRCPVRVAGQRRRDVQDQPARRARLRRLRRRGRGGDECGRPRHRRGQRSRRHRGRHRTGVGAMRCQQHPAARVRQQRRQAAGQLPQRSGRSAVEVGPRLRSPRAAAGRGRVVARDRRRVVGSGVRVRPGWSTSRRAAERDRRRRAPRSRRAGRRDRLGRRRPTRALPVGRCAERRRTGTHAGPRGARLPRVPGAGRVGAHRCRDRPARRLHLRDRASTCRPTDVGDGGHRGDPGAGRLHGPTAGVRVQDSGRPVRRSGIAVQGGLRHDLGRRSP